MTVPSQVSYVRKTFSINWTESFVSSTKFYDQQFVGLHYFLTRGVEFFQVGVICMSIRVEVMKSIKY